MLLSFEITSVSFQGSSVQCSKHHSSPKLLVHMSSSEKNAYKIRVFFQAGGRLECGILIIQCILWSLKHLVQNSMRAGCSCVSVFYVLLLLLCIRVLCNRNCIWSNIKQVVLFSVDVFSRRCV